MAKQITRGYVTQREDGSLQTICNPNIYLLRDLIIPSTPPFPSFNEFLVRNNEQCVIFFHRSVQSSLNVFEVFLVYRLTKVCVLMSYVIDF